MAAADKGMYGAMGLKKGGMATKKKAGKISEYGGKEMYSSKKGMMKHEGMESMKMEIPLVASAACRLVTLLVVEGALVS